MKCGKKLICIIVFILSICLIGSGIYFIVNSNKAVFLKKISNYYKEKTNNISILGADGVTKGEINVTANYGEKKIKFSGDIYYDLVSYLAYADINVNMMQKDKNTFLYFDKDKLYFKFKEIEDVLYKIPIQDLSLKERKVYKEKLKENFEILKSSIVNNLPESAFSKENKTIKIGEDSFETSMYILSIKYRDIYNILIDYLNKISENKSLLKTFEISADEINNGKEELKSVWNSAENKVKDEEKIKYIIYLNKSGELIQQDLKIDLLNIKLSDHKLKNSGETFDLSILYDKAEYISFNIFPKSKNNSTITGKVLDLYSFNGNLTKNLNKSTFDLSLKMMNSEILNLNYATEEILKDKKYKAIINVEADEIDINAESIITFNEKIPSVDLSKAIEATEEIIAKYKESIDMFR